MIKVFNEVGTFQANYAAEAWCEKHGISVGRSQGMEPRGLLFGDFDIAKWRNLNAVERSALHGTMTGDGRNGPVTVTLKDDAVKLHRSELLL